MKDLTIRLLRPSDAEELGAAFDAIGWNKPVAQFRRYFEEQEAGRRTVLVAEVGEEFAGYVTLDRRPTYEPFRAGDIPEISDLNVLPSMQRHGVGSALLDAAEAEAGRRSDRVGIRVGLTKDYGAAQRLYVKRGYIPDGRGVMRRNRPVVHGETVLVDDDLVLSMTKRLEVGTSALQSD